MKYFQWDIAGLVHAAQPSNVEHPRTVCGQPIIPTFGDPVEEEPEPFNIAATGVCFLCSKKVAEATTGVWTE